MLEIFKPSQDYDLLKQGEIRMIGNEVEEGVFHLMNVN